MIYHTIIEYADGAEDQTWTTDAGKALDELMEDVRDPAITSISVHGSGSVGCLLYTDDDKRVVIVDINSEAFEELRSCLFNK